MLLDRQHEDGQDEQECQEHLDEEASDDRSATTQGCAYCHGTWEQARDDSGGHNCSKKLGQNEQGGLEPTNSPVSSKGKCDLKMMELAVLEVLAWVDTYGGIELSTTDTKEDPDIDCEGDAKCECDVQQC